MPTVKVWNYCTSLSTGSARPISLYYKEQEMGCTLVPTFCNWYCSSRWLEELKKKKNFWCDSTVDVAPDENYCISSCYNHNHVVLIMFRAFLNSAFHMQVTVQAFSSMMQVTVLTIPVVLFVVLHTRVRVMLSDVSG